MAADDMNEIEGLPAGATVVLRKQSQSQSPAQGIEGLPVGATVVPRADSGASSSSSDVWNTGSDFPTPNDSLLPAPVEKAWHWANAPISYSRPGPLKYLLPKSPAEVAQEADEKAHELHPDDSWITNYVRAAGYGMARDLNRMISPLTAATAAAGAAAPALGAAG